MSKVLKLFLIWNASFHFKTFFSKPVYQSSYQTNHPTSDISYLNHCPQWSKHETWIIFPSWFYSCLIDPWQTCSTASAEWIRNCWRYSSTSKYIPTHLLLFRVCNQDTIVVWPNIPTQHQHVNKLLCKLWQTTTTTTGPGLAW